MAIDPQFREAISRFRDAFSGLSARFDLSAAREALARTVAQLEGPAPALADVRPVLVPGGAGDRPGRLYTPLAAGTDAGPGLVYFHGGGFTLGGLDTHDGVCRRLAASSGVRVLSVAYRLAPEHAFPAGWEDARAALRSALSADNPWRIDPTRVAVGGDSAGANLAAGLAQALRAEPGLRYQLLLYPLLQLVQTDHARAKPFQGGPMADLALDQIKKVYLTDPALAHDPRVSPLFESNLVGLAPAYVLTAELDPLRAEGRAYVDRLRAAGVGVETADYARMPHGFLNLTAVFDTAHEALEKAGTALGRSLS
ncbi:MAG: alpha/beta hydrolase [Maricaulaceae bacterium]